MPLFDRQASPDNTANAVSDEEGPSFKEKLLRSHLGEARHLSTSLAFNAFKVRKSFFYDRNLVYDYF